jgi:hypothetical protein
MTRQLVALIALCALSVILVALNTTAQQTDIANSWLDRPLVNWNRQGKELPRLPRVTAIGETPLSERCREQVRQPAVPAERAVVKLSWTLYGPAQLFGAARVFTAMGGVDGMCRPLGYQAFVYSEGRYAGTLSPVAMNSRTDGALTTIRLVSARRILAEFTRYTDTDPLCCPARMSTVIFNLKNDEIPELTPANVMTSATTRLELPANKP